MLGLAAQGLRLLHRVSVKGEPASELPRSDDRRWAEAHVRGYRSAAAVLE